MNDRATHRTELLRANILNTKFKNSYTAIGELVFIAVENNERKLARFFLSQGRH